MAKKSRYYVRPDGLHETIRTIRGRRVAFRGRTDREVDLKILEYQEREARGRAFSEIADAWENEHEAVVSESTRRVYAVAARRLRDAFPGFASEIRPLDIQRYMARFEKQGYSAQTVTIELSCLRQILDYAVIAGDIDVNPAAAIKKSRGLPRKKRTALTEEQEAAVKAAGRAKSAHWWLFGYLLLYTGLRRGEALALSYSDIDRRSGVIHVNKKLSYAYGSRPVMEDHLKSENGLRDVPLLPPLAEALEPNRIGLLFPGTDGGYMPTSQIQANWRRYCRDVGLNEIQRTDDGGTVETFPVTPHMFRHSMATICYEAGLDPRQAAQILGDTPEVVQAVYTHLRDGRRQTAAEKLQEHFAKTGTV